jgi:hypothetical protein
LFSEKTNQTLASATKLAFPLSHMAQTFENDTTLYSHASEAIFDQYMQQLVTTSVTSQIDMFNWRFYLQRLPAFALIPVIAVIIRQHIKINQISQIVAVLSSLPRTHSFELRRQDAVTATTLVDEKSEVIQDYSAGLFKQLVSRDIGHCTCMY